MVWNTLTDNLEVVYGAGVALVIVVLLTPAVGGMARMLGVVDRPGEGRRAHGRTVPRLGGLALGFGIWIQRFTFPIIGVHQLPAWVGMPLTVLGIVAIMNMVNFLDGLDGLAA